MRRFVLTSWIAVSISAAAHAAPGDPLFTRSLGEGVGWDVTGDGSGETVAVVSSAFHTLLTRVFSNTGTVLWTQDWSYLSGASASGVVLDGGKAFVVGTGQAGSPVVLTRAYDQLTGLLVWGSESFPSPVSGTGAALATGGGWLTTVGELDGTASPGRSVLFGQLLPNQRATTVERRGGL